MAAATIACSAARPVVAQAAFTGARQQPAVFSKPCLSRPSLARTAKVQQRSPAVETRAVSEIAQVAGEAGFIFGVSGVMAAITLVGLAFGFVLLRVESLAEEGKI